MTSKNDLMNKLREQDVLLTALLNGTHGISRSLSAIEKAQNQPSLDPEELEQLRTANEQLIQQNGELTASNQRIRELSTKRWKDIQDLRAENTRLKDENNELVASKRRIVDRSLETDDENRDLKTDNYALLQELKRYVNLESENARLRELLAVTDQHAGEIVRALAIAEGENK